MMDVPVVCGHELSSSQDFMSERSRGLNAKLLPIIASLIESVKKVLRGRGINAPLMIVKGDGSLMSESVARVSLSKHCSQALLPASTEPFTAVSKRCLG